jgi:hypothetical protein
LTFNVAFALDIIFMAVDVGAFGLTLLHTRSAQPSPAHYQTKDNDTEETI